MSIANESETRFRRARIPTNAAVLLTNDIQLAMEVVTQLKLKSRQPASHVRTRCSNPLYSVTADCVIMKKARIKFQGQAANKSGATPHIGTLPNGWRRIGLFTPATRVRLPYGTPRCLSIPQLASFVQHPTRYFGYYHRVRGRTHLSIKTPLIVKEYTRRGNVRKSGLACLNSGPPGN